MRLRSAAIAACCFALPAFHAPAQSTFATITGTVTDPAGAVVPNVRIEATETSKNYRFVTLSNEQGNYTLANIPDGTYQITASAEGFSPFRAEDVILTVRDNRRIDVRLSLDTVGTTVEVTGGATLIETETARVASTMERQVMRSLPLTLRRAWDYFTMTPQVERTSNWSIRIGGTGNNQSEATIDGTSIATAGGGPIGPLLDRTELVQEMRIDVAMGSAEQPTLGQVTMISRSGSNDFHGTIADYYTTPAFRARNPFNQRRDTLREHRTVFSAGGPVYLPKLYDGRNKTFFFHTTEIVFGSQNNLSVNRTVPLETWRAGDFSNLLPGTVIVDPQNGQPFPGNRIPAGRINPMSAAIQERYFPTANFGETSLFATNNFRDTWLVPIAHQPTITTRIDHRFSDKNFLYLRMTNVRWNFTRPETSFPTLRDTKSLSRRDMDALTLAHTYTIAPSLLNEFRLGWNNQNQPSKSVVNGRQFAEEFGLSGLAPDLPDATGIHRVNFQNLGISGLSTRSDCDPCGRDRVISITNNITKIIGAHTLKMGTNLRKSNYLDVRQGDALFGRSTFSNRFTGHTYADFLLGIPSTLERNFPTIEQNRTRWSHGFYFTDEWKATQRLTLTLGLRWDTQMPWTEKGGRLAMFDIGSGQIVVPDGSLAKVSPLMPDGYVSVVEASALGLPSDSLLKADLNNWSPRAGFAWRPFGNNTVFRGGVGVAYNQSPRGLTAVGIPFVITEPAYTNPLDNPLVWPAVFPSGGVGGPASVSLPSAVRPDLRVPRVTQYQFTIEHQRWDMGFHLGYTGTNTRQGVYTWNVNQPVADERLFTEKSRRFLQYPDIFYADNGAGHQYHALTAQVMRRYRAGLHFQAYYTLARDIGDLEDGQSPEDAFDRRRERAAWERLPTHRFSSHMMWDVPFGRGRMFSSRNRFLEAVFGGWQLSAIVALESGRLLTPQWTGPDPTGTRFTTSGTRPVVTLRPDHLHDSRLDDPTVDRWFDLTAFGAPPVGRFGTAAKGTILGPGTAVLHNSVAKHFMLGERLRLRVEMLANNTFNHPNYADPNTNITAGANVAGVVTSTIDRNAKFDTAIPRELQLLLRLEW